MKCLLGLFFLCGASSGLAKDSMEPFNAKRWTEGMHLLAGLGVNTAHFSSNTNKQDVGVGLAIQTNVGYFFLDSFAIEASTQVTLHKVKKLLIWDTLETLGMRFRLPPPWFDATSSRYVRVLGGRGPSVLIYKGEKPKDLDLDLTGDRTELEGEVFGLGYGLFQTAKDGSTWFMELTATGHRYARASAIVEKDEVPEVTVTRRVDNRSRLYAIGLTFGVVAF